MKYIEPFEGPALVLPREGASHDASFDVTYRARLEFRGESLELGLCSKSRADRIHRFVSQVADIAFDEGRTLEETSGNA